MSEPTTADPVLAARKALMKAIWRCISDASSMQVVMSGGDVNAAATDYAAEAHADGIREERARLRAAVLAFRSEIPEWEIDRDSELTAAVRTLDRVLALLEYPT